jgi:lipoprotein-anchoring transpeptidase ErfK/SrfK
LVEIWRLSKKILASARNTYYRIKQQLFNFTGMSIGIAMRLSGARFVMPLAKVLVIIGSGCLVSCASTPNREVVVSIRDQRVALMKEGQAVRVYGCSTSKFGVGDGRGTYATPVGKLAVATKIGAGLPPGAVFKNRRPTGEILPADAPGRDPIVTRILWLRGLQVQNKAAFGRFIYIHGTPEERNIGRPASYGCVRMRSCDIIDLFDNVAIGTPVRIDKGSLPGDAQRLARSMERAEPIQLPRDPVPAETPRLLARASFTPQVTP